MKNFKFWLLWTVTLIVISLSFSPAVRMFQEDLNSYWMPINIVVGVILSTTMLLTSMFVHGQFKEIDNLKINI